MPHTIPIKHYFGGSSADLAIHPTFPILSSSSGSLISVLDACLINGFGSVNLSSLVIDGNGIATATSAAHGYNKVHIVIEISNAEQTTINGQWRIISTTANTIVLDTVASGLTNITCTSETTITLKIPALGWQKVFYDPATSVVVYRSLDPTSRRHFLRIDDADGSSVTPRFSYIRGYEMMTSTADNGILPFPLSASFPRGLGILRDYYQNSGKYIPSDSSNISWTLVGSSKQLYFRDSIFSGTEPRASTNCFFGDMISYIPGDIGGTLLAGATNFANTYSLSGAFESWESFTGKYSPRPGTRWFSKSNQRWRLRSPSTQGTYIGIGSPTIPAPEPLSNRYYIYKPILITDESVTTYIRGEMPGMAICLNDLATQTPYVEPNTIFVMNDTRYIYMPQFTYSATYGNFLLNLDSDWTTPSLIT